MRTDDEDLARVGAIALALLVLQRIKREVDRG